MHDERALSATFCRSQWRSKSYLATLPIVSPISNLAATQGLPNQILVSNRSGSSMTGLPDFKAGISYWEGVEASVDGVLGGFGTGPLPRVEQLSSRLFLLSLIPALQSFPSPLSSSLSQPSPRPRYVGLDVGAGVGRVTAEVLLPLLDDVITIEPVKHFIHQAKKNSSSWRFFGDSPATTHSAIDDMDDAGSPAAKRQKTTGGSGGKFGNSSNGKRVWFIQGALNDLDPKRPCDGEGSQSLGVYGGSGADDEFGERAEEILYDVVWCQWCLGHLSHPALIEFLKRARLALRPDVSTSHTPYVFVKENVCEDDPNSGATEVLDEEDSSLTRSNLKWEEIFKEAGLTIVKEQVQLGLPEGLFMVKMWAVR